MTVAADSSPLAPLRAAGVTAAILPKLSDDSEIVRCAAARCLGHLADREAAPALVALLLDEDEDVRTDAMTALVRCARPEDAEAIRASLEGDPVPEVKVVAVEVLAAIGDQAAIPRLRALVRDRCAEEVAWDDDNGYWDDWLDVQSAAVKALGALAASDAIDDILEARIDEMGQALDETALPALAAMSGGAEALLVLSRDRDERTRARAISALAASDAERLDPLTDRLLADPAAAVRLAAVRKCSIRVGRIRDLALDDADPAVRRAALRRLGSGDDWTMRKALADPDEETRAVALEQLGVPAEGEPHGDLAANIEAWALSAGATLASVAIRLLPHVAGDRAIEVLERIAVDAARPLPARLAAVSMLGAEPSPRSVETLGTLLAQPSRQLRAVACDALAGHSVADDRARAEPAIRFLLDAIAQKITPDEPEPDPQSRETGPDAAARRGDDGDRTLKITPDGDIIRIDRMEEPERTAEGGSTLAVLQRPVPRAETGTPSRAARRRVSVEGEGADPAELAATAIRFAARVPGNEITRQLMLCLGSEELIVGRAAAQAMSERASTTPMDEASVTALADALAGKDPVVRAHAGRALVQAGHSGTEIFSRYAEDPDPTVRAMAVEALAAADPTVAIAALEDPSDLVAQAAARACIACGETAIPATAFERCLAAHAVAPAAYLIAGSPAASACAVERLTSGDATLAELQTILGAIEHCAERPAEAA